MLHFEFLVYKANYDAFIAHMRERLRVSGVIVSENLEIDISYLVEHKPEDEHSPYVVEMHGQVNWQKNEKLITFRISDTSPLIVAGECKEVSSKYFIRLLNGFKSAFEVVELSPEGIRREDALTWKEEKQQDRPAELKSKHKNFLGGRPRNPDDDWAYDQVYRIGRTPNEVYPEWCERIGPRVELLVDSRDSFYHALHYRKSKEDTEKTD